MKLNDLKIFLWDVVSICAEIFFQIASFIFKIFRQYPLSYTALLYLFVTMAFCYYPIFDHWSAGFIMMSLPLAVLSGLTAACYLLVKKQKIVAATGFIWLLLTFPLIKRMVGINSNEIKLEDVSALKVLSFNGECFDEKHKTDEHWAKLQADIACFQEYSPNKDIESQYANNVVKLTKFDQKGLIGLAMFSRYPILKQYSKVWDRKNQPNINGYLCADIAYKNDTVRVVNVHLWSMGVRINLAFDALKKGHIKTFGVELADSFRRLKEGFEKRDEQMREVESYVSGSKYPVIICGDFNETPFGYSYGKLKLSFKNAFEEAGQGLGFTLNRQPYFARIDQQFVSQDWHVESYKTISSVNFSDHFPVMAKYVLKKSLIETPALVAIK
ncbi:endonuclease [Emticicia aquatilis]|uniref:Endonuclease n=1 Tax=Emticicia aquatilis TaxID=1537369 RepID=A0A916YVI9_9BACT|nr:endonuclease/exonuclease/phosphatase family protein [Emticicia aquatilis]GGD62332.1 endonuclease [Emticicia aquatilis]